MLTTPAPASPQVSGLCSTFRSTRGILDLGHEQQTLRYIGACKFAHRACIGMLPAILLVLCPRICFTLACATAAKSAEPGLWMPTPGSTKVRALDEEPAFFRCCLRARLEGEGDGEGEGELVGDASDPASDQLNDPLHECANTSSALTASNLQHLLMQRIILHQQMQ